MKAARPSYIELLKNRDFRLLWLGQGISNLGDWIIVVAMIALVYKLSKSPLAVAVLMIARLLPALFFGPVVGVIVDRFDRKKLMIGCDIMRGLLVISLPFMRNFYGLLAVAFVLEAFALIFMPAKDASIPNIVSEDRLLAANSLSHTTNYLTMILGSAFAGTIILFVDSILGGIPFFRQLTGPNAAFYIDAATFFVSATMISRIPLKREAAPAPGAARPGVREDLLTGLKLVRGDPLIKSMLISLGIAILGGGSIYSLGVVYTEQVLGVGSAGFGYLIAALGVGLVIGAASTEAVGRFIEKGRLFALSILGFGGSLLVFSLVTYYEISVIAIVLAGVCLAAGQVSAFTILQENVADAVRGRIFGMLESLTRVSLLTSLAITGAVAEMIGNRTFRIDSARMDINGAQVTLLFGAIVILTAGLVALKRVGAAAGRGAPTLAAGAVRTPGRKGRRRDAGADEAHSEDRFMDDYWAACESRASGPPAGKSRTDREK